MSSELTKSCLTFESRPATPPEIRKFRRSTNLEPGKRFQHPGVAEDYTQMKLDEKIFGYVDKSVKTTASDLLSHPKPTELERINRVRVESIYKSVKREPLGRSPERSVVLPSKFTLGNQPFGESSRDGEPAKDIIFPTMASDTDSGVDLYKRSHGSYGPGEQKTRDYKWNIDPVATRFGRKGDTIALNGASTNIADVLHDNSASTQNVVNLKQVENFRNMGVILGQSKNLGQDSASRSSDMVYGKKNPNKGLSALEVIRGKYSEEETAPDKDLGKSIMPGFRNISLEDRAYGCPSIRNDIPTVHPSRRSLADAQNYGDDVPAQDLINPPAFSDLSIGPMVMQEQRTKEQLLDLFQRTGYKFSQQKADEIFNRASKGRPTASINEFRDVLNDFLITNDLVRK